MVVRPNPKQTPGRRGATSHPNGAQRSACCFLRRHDPFRFEGSSGRAHRNLSPPRRTPLQASGTQGRSTAGASGIFINSPDVIARAGLR
jgi:hypothetical protein